MVQAFKLPRGAADPLDLLYVDGLEERLARREVAIQRADADVGASGDPLQRGVLPLRGEGLTGGSEQLVVVARRVGALRALGLGGCREFA